MAASDNDKNDAFQLEQQLTSVPTCSNYNDSSQFSLLNLINLSKFLGLQLEMLSVTKQLTTIMSELEMDTRKVLLTTAVLRHDIGSVFLAELNIIDQRWSQI